MTRRRVPPRWSAIWREAGARRERRRGSESLSVGWVEALLELRLLGIAGRRWARSLRWLGRALRDVLRSRSRIRSLTGSRSLHALFRTSQYVIDNVKWKKSPEWRN
jgi:hypothetical protein